MGRMVRIFVLADSLRHYDDALSRELTALVTGANLESEGAGI